MYKCRYHGNSWYFWSTCVSSGGRNTSDIFVASGAEMKETVCTITSNMHQVSLGSDKGVANGKSLSIHNYWTIINYWMSLAGIWSHSFLTHLSSVWNLLVAELHPSVGCEDLNLHTDAHGYICIKNSWDLSCLYLHRSPKTQFPLWKNLQIMAAGLLLVRSWEYRQFSPPLQRPCRKYLQTQNKNKDFLSDENSETKYLLIFRTKSQSNLYKFEKLNNPLTFHLKQLWANFHFHVGDTTSLIGFSTQFNTSRSLPKALTTSLTNQLN